MPSHLSNLRVLFSDFSANMQQQLQSLNGGVLDNSRDEEEEDSSETHWQYDTNYWSEGCSEEEETTEESCSDMSLDRSDFEAESLSNEEEDDGPFVGVSPYE